VTPLQFFYALRDAANRGPWTLAIVVRTRGSTPRRAGAMMAVNQRAELISSIGGGAGEARVVQTVLHNSNTTDVSINLSGRGNEIDGICGGDMTVQIVRLPPSTLHRTLVPIIACLRSGGQYWISIKDLAISNQDSPTAFEVHAMPQVVIVGAGHCGTALANLTDDLGFPTIVADDRETIPNMVGGNIHYTQDLRVAVSQLYADPAPFAVLLTRHFEQDLGALRSLRESRLVFGFLGMMGSAKRIREVFTALQDDAFAQHITAPVGLDIAAQTPTEIAVSIAAQLIAVKQRHDARHAS
jgi:xanthine dehydrogenase accessory factor